MVTLEQVKLLETKVAKAIEYVKRQSDENALLRQKLDGYRARIDELEVLVQQFKEDQGRIEKGIVSALNRLNQFEDAIESGLSAAAAAAAVPVDGAAPVVDAPQAEGLPVSVPLGFEVSQELISELKEAPSEGGLSPSDEELLAALEAEEAAAKVAQAERTGVYASEALGHAPSGAAAELDIF